MQHILIIYIKNNVDGEFVHQVIGPFDDREKAFLHVDKIRTSLDDACKTMKQEWSYAVWPLTNPEV